MTLQDRVAGILIGLAAGDRIGGPSRMALTLAKSLVTQQHFNLEHIGQSYLTWWQTEGFDTGPTAAQVFSLVERGLTFSQAAAQVHENRRGLTAGCNPIHRAAPLAAFASIPDQQLSQCAKQEAALTHQHLLAGGVSATAFKLCRLLIRHSDLELAMKQLNLKSSNRQQLKPDGFAPHVFATALYFVHTYDQFDEMLQASIDFAGPANYSPVLAGAIGGAYWGATAVADSWFSNQPFLKKIYQTANQLAQGWENGV